MMSIHENQTVDDGKLSTTWSLACGALAAGVSYSVGNVPMIVLALSVTVADLATRIHSAAMRSQGESLDRYRGMPIRRPR